MIDIQTDLRPELPTVFGAKRLTMIRVVVHFVLASGRGVGVFTLLA